MSRVDTHLGREILDIPPLVNPAQMDASQIDRIPADSEQADPVRPEPAQADLPEVRREVLERLREWDFVPPREELEAICRLLGIAVPERTERMMWQVRLRKALDSFCDRFWSFSPQARAWKWSALDRACGSSPALRSRLQLLLPLLDFEMPDLSHESVLVRDLAGLMGELCLLPPPEQGVHRRTRLDLLRQTDAAGLAAAANYMAIAYPGLAQLDRGLTLREAGQRPVPRILLHTRRRRAAPRWVRWFRPVHPTPLPPRISAAQVQGNEAFERRVAGFIATATLVAILLVAFLMIFIVEPRKRAERERLRTPPANPAIRQAVLEAIRKANARKAPPPPDDSSRGDALRPLINKLLEERRQSQKLDDPAGAAGLPPAALEVPVLPAQPEAADE